VPAETGDLACSFDTFRLEMAQMIARYRSLLESASLDEARRRSIERLLRKDRG
jgi:L-asparaginase II